jgi:hypothetical protein
VIGLLEGPIADLRLGLKSEAEAATGDVSADLLRALGPAFTVAEMGSARIIPADAGCATVGGRARSRNGLIRCRTRTARGSPGRAFVGAWFILSEEIESSPAGRQSMMLAKPRLGRPALQGITRVRAFTRDI